MTPITTLADKALLVKLSRSTYQPYVHDKEATAIVAQQMGVQNAGRFSKRLFRDSPQLKATNEAFATLYTTYIKSTVPWLDDGVRMAPNALYFELAAELRTLIASAKAAADKLEADWDGMVAADIARLGALGRAEDYPSSREVREKFDAQVRFFPIPQSQDFRTEVTDADKAEMEAAIAEAAANVTKHLIKEMLEPVAKLAAKLAVPIGGESSIFRNTMVENVMEEVARAEKLNITGDPEVAELVASIKATLTPYAAVPDALREDPDKRAALAAKMRELQDKMAGLVG